MRVTHFVKTTEAQPSICLDAAAMVRPARRALNEDKIVEIKARLRIPSRRFVEQAQRRVRRSGPFRCVTLMNSSG